jgi:hypothetical protein
VIVTEAEQQASDIRFVRAEMAQRAGFPWPIVAPLIVRFLPLLIEIVQYLLAQRMVDKATPADAQREAEWIVTGTTPETRARYAVHRSGRAG